MQISEHVKIYSLNPPELSKPNRKFYSVLWIKDTVEKIWINDELYSAVSNTIFFLSPKHQWHICRGDGQSPHHGYLLGLSDTILNEPFLNRLQINALRVLHPEVIYSAPVTPELEKRLKSIFEMLEELMSSALKHAEDAVLALINTFFVYCDGLCKEEPPVYSYNSKAVLVYKFINYLEADATEIKKVRQYAEKMNVSTTYLNECVQDVLGMNTKNLLIQHLVARTANALKFTNKPVKVIAFELGFSSADYFSFFCKKHLGHSPSAYRKS